LPARTAYPSQAQALKLKLKLKLKLRASKPLTTHTRLRKPSNILLSAYKYKSMKSLIDDEQFICKFKLKVSSVLNRSVEFAGMNMFDRNEETCWNSEGQGADAPQSIFLDLGRKVKVQQLMLTFQGGFVGQDAVVAMGDSPGTLAAVCLLGDIDDCNDRQVFDVPAVAEIENNSSSSSSGANEGRYLKITFPRSTDFFGRVTIYDLDVLGEEQ
jgi:hypothetical protein